MNSSQENSRQLRIAVIGGGLTGLAAAHRLGELSRDARRPVDVHLFEASDRLGGLVGTVERDGYLIDTGADSFITNKPGALELCRRIGLEDRLQPTEARFRGALVLRNGRPYPVPEGFQLLSPSALWPVLTSPVLSWRGKLRLSCEVFVPRRKDASDESLADFVRRRFGREALDRLVQPLVGGIYTSDPEKLSLAATMPRFIEQERKYGSLIRAAYALRSPAEDEDRTSSGARYGLFAGLRGGMGDLVRALVERVAASCRMRTGTKVVRCRENPASASGRFALEFGDGTAQTFDAAILTPAAYRAAEIVDAVDARLAAALRRIEYASSAIVVTGHRLADVAHPLNAFGLVVPHIERRRILAVSFSSRKFPNRAPAGHVLLRTFVGGALQPELFELDDDALVRLVKEELHATLGVQGDPEFSIVVRYPRAMPQFHVGHLELVAEIERLTAEHAGLAIAGNAYRGVGVPDAIHSGEQAAERIVRRLGAETTPGGSPL